MIEDVASEGLHAWIARKPQNARLFGVLMAVASLILGGLAFYKWQATPRVPTLMTAEQLATVEVTGQFVRIEGANWQCMHARASGEQVYAPVLDAPKVFVLAFIDQRPCDELSEMPPEGYLEIPKLERLEKLGMSGRLAQGRVLVIDMVDTPGFFLLGAIFGAAMALGGVYLAIAATREMKATRSAPQ